MSHVDLRSLLGPGTYVLLDLHLDPGGANGSDSVTATFRHPLGHEFTLLCRACRDFELKTDHSPPVQFAGLVVDDVPGDHQGPVAVRIRACEDEGNDFSLSAREIVVESVTH